MFFECFRYFECCGSFMGDLDVLDVLKVNSVPFGGALGVLGVLGSLQVF